jgi:hypothetical protein
MQSKRFQFFISVVFVLLAANSFAQKSEKQIGLGTGWYYHRFKDASIFNTSQTGGSMSLLLFYRANGIKNRHHVQYLTTSPSIKSNYLLNRESLWTIQYAYHRKIVEFNELSFFGGVQGEFAHASRSYSELGNSYSYNKPFSTGENVVTFSPSILLERSIEKDKLTLQCWATLFGFVAPYRLRDAEFKGLGTDLSKIETRVSYNRFFSERWEGRLDYLFQFYRLNYPFQNSVYTPAQITSTSHQVNLSLVYKFH